MSDDLIRRSDAIKAVDAFLGTDPIVERIKRIPSADRPQGEWIEERANDADFISWHRWKCSVCGDWQTYGTPRYCPNCGADMRGDNDGKDIQSADE